MVGKALGSVLCVAVLGAGTYAAGAVRGVKFDSVVDDVGSVPEGREITSRFKFRNRGLEASILDVSGSCNNVSASLVNRSVVARGESGAVETRVATAGTEGLQTSTIAVRVRDPFERTIVLTVRAHVEREFVPDVGIVDFGKVPRATSAQRLLGIRVNSQGQRVLSARSTDESFDVYVDQRYEPAPARLVVIARPRSERGLRFGTIRISTSSFHMPELIVPVRVQITD
jgi:hypothetical protein